MGRYYQIGLKNKSEKNINKVNAILEKEFNVEHELFEDGFIDTTFISTKYMKDEFNYVKNSKNYNQFTFSSYTQEDLTFETYSKIREQLGDKIGFSKRFKISALIKDEGIIVNALSKMVDSEQYKDLFIIKSTKDNFFISYDTHKLVHSYCEHLL